jgi:4a-hydroxytetrahydrobiopterin dehydratase
MRLTDEEREAALGTLSGWRFDAEIGAIRRSFRFADFSAAFAFMTRVALAAEKADHHPDWSNSWNKVDIALSTHSAGGLTQLDIDLARRIVALAGEGAR